MFFALDSPRRVAYTVKFLTVRYTYFLRLLFQSKKTLLLGFPIETLLSSIPQKLQ